MFVSKQAGFPFVSLYTWPKKIVSQKEMIKHGNNGTKSHSKGASQLVLVFSPIQRRARNKKKRARRCGEGL